MNDRNRYIATSDSEFLRRLSDVDLAATAEARDAHCRDCQVEVDKARERLDLDRLRLAHEDDDYKAKSAGLAEQLTQLGQLKPKASLEARLADLRASRLRWWRLWAMMRRARLRKSLTAQLVALLGVEGLIGATERWLESRDADLPGHRELSAARALHTVAVQEAERSAHELEQRTLDGLTRDLAQLPNLTDDRLQEMLRELTALQTAFRARVQGGQGGQQALQASYAMRDALSRVHDEIQARRIAKSSNQQAAADDDGGDGNGDDDDDDDVSGTPPTPKG